MSSNSDISPNKAGQSFQIDGNLHDFLNFSLIWKFYSRNSDILLRGITLWKSREICFIYLIQFSKRMLSWHLYVVFFRQRMDLRTTVPHWTVLGTLSLIRHYWTHQPIETKVNWPLLATGPEGRLVNAILRYRGGRVLEYAVHPAQFCQYSLNYILFKCIKGQVTWTHLPKPKICSL